MKRGKKGKLKKLKRKYADQTDEERALAMAALGHKVTAEAAAGAQGAGKRKKGKGKKKNGETETSSSQPPPSEALAPATMQTREVKAAKAQAAPQTEIKKHDRSDALAIASVQPVFTDASQTLSACVMVGPYDSMKRCKYKVKIVPGSVKRGKASKSIMESKKRLQHICLMNGKHLGTISHCFVLFVILVIYRSCSNDVERAFMRSLTDTELTANLPKTCSIQSNSNQKKV